MLDKKNVNIKGTLLKPNMVVSGTENNYQAPIEEVAEKTLQCLKSSVPDELPGIVFLSGGQSDLDATAHLDAMIKIGGFKWNLSFSYGRGLQASALKEFGKDQKNIANIQNAFNHRAKMNGLSSKGKWSENLEKESAA